jgi:hypothetical protein
VALCTPHHKSISLNLWKDVLLYDGNGEPERYAIMDSHGETIHEVKLGADRAAAEGDESASGKNEQPMTAPRARRADKDCSLVLGVESSPSAAAPSASLTHERCVELTAEIRDTQRNRQWRAGDLGNLFIRVLNEKADQYICDFGFAEPTIANILKVCEAITPEERHDDVSFSHCAVYYKQNREDRDMWRDVVLEEKLTVRELRERVHGKRPETTLTCPECGVERPRSEFRRT